MFYYFNGEVTLLESNLAVIDCGGVGYACRTSSYTLSRLHVGERARLYTYCSIREDAFDIYGFSTREELRNFELLLGVTGVGAKAALAILSSTTPDRFALAIFSQDEKALTAAPGVGKKLAQRILLELKEEEPELVAPELVEEYRAMIKEGCEQEIRWGHYAIGDEVAGLNKQMVTDYIQYLGNLRCTQLGFEPLYEGHEREPESMSWVSQFSNANMIKTDFFEARSTAYAKSSALVDDL